MLSQLAEDLQAVADDLPLPHTRRALAQPRGFLDTPPPAADHNRGNGSVLDLGFARRGIRPADGADPTCCGRPRTSSTWARRRSIAGIFPTPRPTSTTRPNLAAQSKLTPWSYLAGLQDIGQITEQLKSKIEDPSTARYARKLRPGARKIAVGGTRRADAEAGRRAFPAADDLRFQLLLDEGAELNEATVELQRVLAPFFVLESADWTQLGHTMGLLDDARRERIVNDVNELLFLWMATIDESAWNSTGSNGEPGRP